MKLDREAASIVSRAEEARNAVLVLEDGIGAVDVTPGDGERALAEMRRAGAELVRSDRV